MVYGIYIVRVSIQIYQVCIEHLKGRTATGSRDWGHLCTYIYIYIWHVLASRESLQQTRSIVNYRPNLYSRLPETARKSLSVRSPHAHCPVYVTRPPRAAISSSEKPRGGELQSPLCHKEKISNSRPQWLTAIYKHPRAFVPPKRKLILIPPRVNDF